MANPICLLNWFNLFYTLLINIQWWSSLHTLARAEQKKRRNGPTSSTHYQKGAETGINTGSMGLTFDPLAVYSLLFSAIYFRFPQEKQNKIMKCGFRGPGN